MDWKNIIGLCAFVVAVCTPSILLCLFAIARQLVILRRLWLRNGLRHTSMTNCTKCDKPSNPTYMCDLDPEEGQYCAECFNELGCEVEHEEGCMTMAVSDD